MTAVGVLGCVLVRAGASELRRNVLIKRAAEGHVNRLSAAANAENRKIPFERRAEDFELKFGPRCFDFTELPYRAFAVVARVDVKIAPAKDKSIERFEQSADSRVAAIRRQDDGSRAGALDGGEISRRQEQCRIFGFVGESPGGNRDIGGNADQRSNAAGHFSYKRL